MKDLTKLDMYRELLTNRYLLTTILVNMYSLMDNIKVQEKIISKVLSVNEKKEIEELQSKREVIQFEYFNLSAKQYQALVTEYKPEIVTDCIVILDGYYKIGKSYKNNYKKLKTLCDEMSKKEQISKDLDKMIYALRSMDYTLIEDIEVAKKYIKATPEYIRNIDKGCIYLRERFNLNDN